jgi:cytochrome P450
MFAGTDTTSRMLARIVMYLSQHPQWLEAAWQEQRTLVAEFGESLDRKVRAHACHARFTPARRL